MFRRPIFIMDLDLTLTSDCFGRGNLRGYTFILALLDFIHMNGWKVYIVTARRWNGWPGTLRYGLPNEIYYKIMEINQGVPFRRWFYWYNSHWMDPGDLKMSQIGDIVTRERYGIPDFRDVVFFDDASTNLRAFHRKIRSSMYNWNEMLFIGGEDECVFTPKNIVRFLDSGMAKRCEFKQFLFSV